MWRADMSARAFDVVKQWHKLPLKLRQRYWRETEFGKREPNEELMRVIQEASEKVLQRETPGHGG